MYAGQWQTMTFRPTATGARKINCFCYDSREGEFDESQRDGVVIVENTSN